MEDLKKIWEPIEILTNKNKFLVIELAGDESEIHIDYAWDKIIADDNIIFEFNKGESKNYKLIGTIKECLENPEILVDVVDGLPKYEEVWDLPKDDLADWEEVNFIDDFGRPYIVMGREKKYRRVIGFNFINYGIPSDVIEYFPLSSPLDSFITLLRKNGLHIQSNDFLILKELNYAPKIEE